MDCRLSFSIFLALIESMEIHRHVLHNGHGGEFSRYRLRVVNVCRDYGMDSRDEAPPDSVILHD